MAEIYTMSEEQAKIWDDYVKEAPEIVKKLSEKFKPNRLYKHTITNQLCVPVSFNENNSVGIVIPSFLNTRLVPSIEVFAVNPERLEECDLPDNIKVTSFKDYNKLLEY